MHIYIDTETTGLKDDAQVVEIGAVARDGDQIVGAFGMRCCPEPGTVDFDDMGTKRALEVNHLTREMVENAPEIARVRRAFAAWLNTYAGGKLGESVFLSAFNNPFDSAILAREPWHIPEKFWGHDVMIRAMNVMGPHGACAPAARRFQVQGQMWSWPRLPNACIFFMKSNRAAHTAVGDVWVTAEIDIVIDSGSVTCPICKGMVTHNGFNCQKCNQTGKLSWDVASL